MIGSGYMSISEAAKYLNMSMEGLRKWEREGKIKSFRTFGGHRRYTKWELDSMVKKPEEINFIGKFNTFTYSEDEINGLIDFIKRNAKSGIIVTIEKA